MANRTRSILFLVCATIVALPSIAAAQQTFNITVGAFVPRGFDARVEGDALVANRNFLVFDMGDFTAGSVSAEWLVPVGEYFEVGGGLGFSRSTVSSVYEDFIDNDGTEVDQDLKLRIVPLTATVRVLPLGQSRGVQPYFGAGVALFNWRYSESGEFVDFNDNNAIFRESFVADGNEPGVVGFGGIRFAADAFSAGGEVRYSAAEADLPSEFVGTRIDLGGWSYLFSFGFRFGG